MGGLKWSDGLANAARELCNDNGASGNVDHIGSDGGKVSHRVKRYSKFSEGLGESIAYGENSGENAILKLYVDDGVPRRGNRKLLLGRGL